MLTELFEKYGNQKPMDLGTAVERTIPVSAVIKMMEEYHEGKVKNLGLFSVSQRSELFFAVLKWAKQADLDYPDEILLKDFEKFTAKNCG